MDVCSVGGPLARSLTRFRVRGSDVCSSLHVLSPRTYEEEILEKEGHLEALTNRISSLEETLKMVRARVVFRLCVPPQHNLRD